MAIQKICGIETEYGIIVRGVAESNPIAASSVLINAYLHSLGTDSQRGPAPKVGWDFEDESPGRDARGDAPEDSLAPEVETHLVNAVLTNGARYYVDHAHPELSTPECADARSVVVWDRAAEVILARSMAAAREHLPPGQEIVVHKNNSDGKGNSYGCHENYLMDRATPFTQIVRQVTPHFVSRQIFTGSGKVGRELPGAEQVDYQLTQRADFFEEEVGLETTLKRPIVNTRDEPHADAQRYRRLHVIVGDANLSEVATLLKVGTTVFVLAMIEDDVLPDDFRLADPGAGAAGGVARPDPGPTARAGERRNDHRARHAVGAVRPGPKVRRLGGDRRRRRRGGRRSGAGAVGARAETAWSTIRCHWPTNSTGWPRSACSTPIASATTSRPTIPEWPASPCSTTTCAPTRACSPGWGSSGSPTTPRSSMQWASRPRTPGPTSEVAASAASAVTSWPPTGTRWCSTSATNRCVGYR